MNRQTLLTIDRVNYFVANLNESQKQIPLRFVETGFNLYEEPGLKEFASMTVGEFLSEISSYNQIPKKIKQLVDVLITSSLEERSFRENDRAENLNEKRELKTTQKSLPEHTDSDFIVQAYEVYETLLDAMMSLNESSVRSAEYLKLSMYTGKSDKEIGKLVNKTHECIRVKRTEFQTNVMSGIVPKRLSDLFRIKDSFVADAKQFASEIENKTFDYVKTHYRHVDDNILRFVLQSLGFTILSIESDEFVVASGNIVEYRRVLEEIRMALRKEFNFTPLGSLFEGMQEATSRFVFDFLISQSKGYEFNEDRTAVRMIGEGLQKITRVARIIFEAGGLIDKDEIATLYAEQYDGDLPTLNSASLRAMGFAPQNKTGKWKFGSIPARLQDIIRQIFTPERPLATLQTIVTAACKMGLDYPLSTIRAYITDIATPENRQNDLFCLKGYCHLYPNYSWRTYRKVVA